MRIFLSLLMQLGLGSLSFAQDTAGGEEAKAVEQPGSAADATSKYEVEIVVFAYDAFDPTEEDLSHNRAIQDSNKPPRAEDRVEEGARDSRAPAAALRSPSQRRAVGRDQEQFPRASFQFELLNSSEFELTAEARRLQSLGAYTVLLHGGWVQDGFPEEAAHDFDISIFGEPRISGTLRLHISRFAHVTAAVNYSASVATGSAPHAAAEGSRFRGAALPSPQFRLHQMRRMRSGELHYLDHPAFGLLIMVRARRESQPDGPAAQKEWRRSVTAVS